MAVLSVLVTLVMMEHQVALALMNVLMAMPISVKLEKVVMVSVPMLLLATLALAHLVTAMTGMQMNGMLQHLVCSIKFVLTSMSVQQMIMTAIAMPPAPILMAVMIVHVILDTPLLKVMLGGKMVAEMLMNVPNSWKLMAPRSQSINVTLMQHALMILALTSVLVILVSMTSTVTVVHVKTSMSATSQQTMTTMSHVLMEMNVSTVMVPQLVNVSLVLEMLTAMVTIANKLMNV